MTRHTFMKSRRGTLVPALATAMLAGMMGCSVDSKPEAALGSTGQASVAPRARLAAFELARPDLTTDALGQKGAHLAGVLYGEAAPVDTFRQAIAVAEAVPGGRHLELGWRPGLKLSYRPVNDDLLVINTDVTRDTASPVDVGVRSAEGTFRAAFQKIAASGEVDPVGLDAASARRSTIVQGEGVSGQLPVERVKEYIFTVPRKINGLEVHDSGVEISVHRNGKLARIKTFGPSVVSTLAPDGQERVTGKGYEFEQAVSHAETEARVRAEYPNAEIKPLGLRYWLPEPGTRDVVAPREIYFVVPTARIEGQTAYARGYFVAYSVKDASEAPIAWPRADPEAKGDARP